MGIEVGDGPYLLVCFCVAFNTTEAWFMAPICCYNTNSKRARSYKDQKVHTCDL